MTDRSTEANYLNKLQFSVNDIPLVIDIDFLLPGGEKRNVFCYDEVAEADITWMETGSGATEFAKRIGAQYSPQPVREQENTAGEIPADDLDF